MKRSKIIIPVLMMSLILASCSGKDPSTSDTTLSSTVVSQTSVASSETTNNEPSTSTEATTKVLETTETTETSEVIETLEDNTKYSKDMLYVAVNKDMTDKKMEELAEKYSFKIIEFDDEYDEYHIVFKEGLTYDELVDMATKLEEEDGIDCCDIRYVDEITTEG